MANTAYPLGAQKMLAGANTIDFVNDTIKVALVSNSYTFRTAHEFLLSLGTVIGTSRPWPTR